MLSPSGDPDVGGSVTEFEVAPYGPSTFFMAGELDIAAAPEFDRLIQGLSTQRGGPTVVDLSAVTFCDVAGARLLVSLAEALPSGCLVLHGVRGRVARLFELIRLTEQRGNVHVLACGVDPYPTGNLSGPSFWDAYAGLLERMRQAYRRLAVETAEMQAASSDLQRRSADLRDASRRVRASVVHHTAA